MQCPSCGKDQDRVIDTRTRDQGRIIRRRRVCDHCGHRFFTIETIETRTLWVIKSDNRREPFDREKLLKGIQIACRKRPISFDQIEKMVDRIERDIEDGYTSEVPSREIGELVIRYLRELDEVAYVRFASVYRKFKDKEEFLRELHRLGEDQTPPLSK